MLNFERSLNFVIAGEKKVGELKVGNVHWAPTREEWCCEWSISCLHPEIGITYGVDPLDAFIKAIDFLSIYIRGTEKDGISVWSKEPGDHGGIAFPLSEDRKWEKIPPGYSGELPNGLQK